MLAMAFLLKAPLLSHAAPTVDFSGIVKDHSTGEPLPYSTISLPGAKMTTTSNVDGRFTLMGAPGASDSLVLIVSHLGFQSGRVALKPGSIPQTVVVRLDPMPTANNLYNEGEGKGAIELEQMEVTARKLDETVKESGISHVTLNPESISKLPSIGDADVFRALQLLPGISGTNESSSGLYVRGGTPDQNLVLLDGFNVYYVDHFFGFFSAFNPDAIKDIQLYKGGFPAKYGGRTSSVMDITGKTGDMNDYNIAGGLSLLDGDLLASVPLWGKGSILLVGRRSYTDVIQSPLYNDIFDLYNTHNSGGGYRRIGGGGGGGGGLYGGSTQPSFYFYDLNGKATYQLDDKDIVSFSAYGGKDNLDNSGTSTFTVTDSAGAATSNTLARTDVTGWGNYGMSAKWGRQWTGVFYSNLVFAYSHYFSDRVDDAQRDYGGNQTSGGTNEDNNVGDVTARIDNEFQLPAENRAGFGGQITRMQTEYHLTENDTGSVLDVRDSALLFSGYLQDEFSGLGKLTLLPGIRFNYYQGTHRYYAEPRASASYALTDFLKLKAAWGIYYQFVNHVEQEDVMLGSSDFWLLADNGISPVSSARHYIVGASYETPMFLIDVEAYRKVLSGLSEFTLSYNLTPPSSTSSDSLFYKGGGTADGIEFLLQKKIGRYTGWIAYTLSQSLNSFPQVNGGAAFPADQDQTHEIKLVNSYSYKKWGFAATWVYATGKPYTQPVGVYTLELLNGASTSFIHVGDQNSFRLPDYHRLDMSATYNCMVNGIKTNVGISLFNVYDRKNVWYKTYESVGGNLVETDVDYLGFTPSVFVKFSLK